MNNTCMNNGGIGGGALKAISAASVWRPAKSHRACRRASEVTGDLQASGKKLLPELTKLGGACNTLAPHGAPTSRSDSLICVTRLGYHCTVKVELWLGEDDSRQSALHMFKNPAKFAADLIAVAEANLGLSGFNLDLESRSTAEDACVQDDTRTWLLPTF
jgi:hypothetical protein